MIFWRALVSFKISMSHNTVKGYLHRTKHFFNKYVSGFPGGAVVESPLADVEDAGFCPGPGRFHMAGRVSHGR